MSPDSPSQHLPSPTAWIQGARGNLERIRALGAGLSERDARALAREIDALLDSLALADRSTIPRPGQPVLLNDLVRDVFARGRPALDRQRTEVRLDLDPELPPVPGDPDGLSQVVLTLVEGAERALEGRRGDNGRLIARTRMTGDGVVLVVVDNGPGIPSDTLSSAYRMHAGSAPAGSLSLTVARAIVREHGGEIWVESREGSGTSVGIHLPHGLPAPASPSSDENGLLAAGRRPGRHLHVLVADDEPTVRMAIRMMLEDRGHRVLEAETADQAFTLAQRYDLDAALVDVRMPGDGIRLLQRLEAEDLLIGRAILLTADATGERTRALLEGGQAYLPKPFRIDALIEAVEKAAR